MSAIAHSLADVGRTVVAATMVIAAIAKLAQLDRFTSVVQILGISGRALASTIGLAVAISEVGAGCLLVVAPRFGAAVVIALLAGFSAVAEMTARRRLHVSCGCFGTISEGAIGRRTTARNALLAFVAAPTLVLESGHLSLPLTLSAVLLVVVGLEASRLLPKAVRGREELETIHTVEAF